MCSSDLLAIFVGQVAAALAAGNAVLAKPAEQTPRIARRAVELLHAAGVPQEVLHFLPGPGDTVGSTLVDHAAVDGVAFTGSTEVAKRIQRRLAAREGAIPVLVAETGGQNVMVVDSSALPEQVVRDVIARHGIESIIHFAAKIVVPESVADPLGYYENNTAKARNLLQCAVEGGVKHFIFSSTAAVYGEPKSTPVREDDQIGRAHV